jgi:hypothetical protein
MQAATSGGSPHTCNAGLGWAMRGDPQEQGSGGWRRYRASGARLWVGGVERDVLAHSHGKGPRHEASVRDRERDVRGVRVLDERAERPTVVWPVEQYGGGRGERAGVMPHGK